jgi:hypothetical protein
VVWPWTIGALLIGFPMLIVMPPLALVLIVVFGASGLKAARQPGAGRRSLAVASGLLLPTLVYFVLWLVGGIAR